MSTIDDLPCQAAVGESAERGRAARRDTPARRTANGHPRPDGPIPVETLPAQAEIRVSGSCRSATGGCSSRPSPSTGRRGRDGQRPRRDASLGHQRAGLRRRPHLELRRVRRPRPPADLRAERLRRDAPRTLGVGRQAARRQRRDRRARRRARAGAVAGSSAHASASTARGCARSPARATWTSGTSGSTPANWSIASAENSARRAGSSSPSPSSGPAQDEPAGRQETHRARRRRAALPPRAAAAGAAAQPPGPRRHPRRGRVRPRAPERLRSEPRRRTTATSSAPTASSTWPARSSGSAASGPAPGSSCWSAARAGTRWCCRPRRHSTRCSSPTWAPASSRTAASGSSVASRSRRPSATSSSAGSGPTGSKAASHDFYVRQLWDWKASADLSTLSESGLHAYSRACGWSLARSHARSGDRLAIAAYLGGGSNFDRAIARLLRGLRRSERARPRTARRCGCRRGSRRRAGDLKLERGRVGECRAMLILIVVIAFLDHHRRIASPSGRWLHAQGLGHGRGPQRPAPLRAPPASARSPSGFDERGRPKASIASWIVS